MQQARLIVDSPAAGDWNMSVDQALLETADQTGAITLRFYEWESATLSLGYFQNYRSRDEHPASSNCQVTRRASGGGAIVHDNELTYSLCIPSRNRWSAENQKLYRLAHEIITGALAAQGIGCRFFDPADSRIEGVEFDESNFLCFQRRTEGDLVCEGFKICGSAQRRVKNSLLQHGSLLISKSEHAPELPGFCDLTGLSCDKSQLISDISAGCAAVLDLQWHNDGLQEHELGSAASIRELKFANDQWIRKR
ncbi:MAG: lipoate--protein ligase family protein [Planctomycetota bacterium]